MEFGDLKPDADDETPRPRYLVTIYLTGGQTLAVVTHDAEFEDQLREGLGTKYKGERHCRTVDGHLVCVDTTQMAAFEFELLR